MQITIFLLFSFFLSACQPQTDKITLQTDHLTIELDHHGFITDITDNGTKTNYIFPDSTSALLQVQVAGEMLKPTKCTFQAKSGLLTLKYQNNIEAQIGYINKGTHFTLELKQISKFETVDLVVWGPYFNTLDKVIGETVGVVQGETFSFGIQSLNLKTMGGYPYFENDIPPQIDIMETKGNLKGKSRYVLYNCEAAKPINEKNSSIQAYCRNRLKERIAPNWSQEHYTLPAYDDGGVIGSKVALFGCNRSETLETLGKIEIAENLAHPMLNGEWAKKARSASAAYLIADFSEDDIDLAIELTKKAGLKYLDHADPFETWGHFKLKKSYFPNDRNGLKKCVDKAEAQGIHIGLHTLTNFVNTNDPYVTPIPNNGLAKTGSSIVTKAIDKQVIEIEIKSPDFFNNEKNNHLRTVQIGKELIRYGHVSEKAPWTLLDCERGAWGTTIADHKAGSTISKLADHAYKVFLTDAQLGMEMAKKLAELYNECGVRQISFDGLEGMYTAGLGKYGEALFPQTWYEHLSPEIKNHFIADGSKTTHFFWHIYTRMNWGEPWYAGFRESQTDYRLKNQAYFKRNLMPAMLGWFKLFPHTPVEDIEWLLARSAAFDAGFAFVINYGTIVSNGNSNAILNFIKIWEEARMANAFTDAQKELMKDLNNEFHLEKIADNKWELNRVYSYKFKHEHKERQPGEPLYSSFHFENAEFDQVLQFNLSAKNTGISKIQLEIDNAKEITLDLSLQEGEHIRYTGGNSLSHFDRFWKLKKTIPVNMDKLKLRKGNHQVNVNCLFTKPKEYALLSIELKLDGVKEIITP